MTAEQQPSVVGTALALMLGLLSGCDSPPVPVPGAPPIGRSVVDDLPDRWIGTQLTFDPGQPTRATLVRFWTDTCPFCEASLPAVEALREEFGARGLATLGIYHPKPPRAVSDAEVVEAAARLGYHGPLAVDEQWAALERMWLSAGDRRATSASFLLDSSGVVRFVHPGPEFHPSLEPDHATCAADYRALRQAILEQLDS
jgi:thiol-disulfide isomerase/thioredoxin